MVPQTIQIPKQGPGRPKTRNTTPVTLNLDIKVAEYLAEMALQYGLHRNHIIETLILSARNDSYPLQVKEENERLKERIKQLESELMELKEKCGGDPYSRKIRVLKERIHRILDEYGEIRVFELVMKVFNVPKGERLHSKVEEFIDGYFIETDGKKLVSNDLELVVIKNKNWQSWLDSHKTPRLLKFLFLYLFFTFVCCFLQSVTFWVLCDNPLFFLLLDK
ncbi:hypothetical protein [Thermococcus sp. PK]|uniref:hypothetical protein n=1 Tax=Thermococcus sp. PK TaxID=913025 RepID=UPI0005B2893D|nr:hypothetical protein [Thermococcus sp. PK]